MSLISNRLARWFPVVALSFTMLARIARCRCGRRFLAAKGAGRATSHRASRSPAAARAASRTSACSRCWKRCASRLRASPGPAWARSSPAHTRSEDRRRTSRRWCSPPTGMKSSATTRPARKLPSRRKLDDYKTLFAPEFGVKNGGLALPKGIIAGVSIEAFLRVVAEPATGIDDFDKLPVPVPRGGDRHRDRRSRRAEPRQRRRGDARQHVGARRDRAGVDGRPPAGRRHDRQQPADRPGAQALRRRGDCRQHRDAPAEARRDHVRACGGQSDDGLPRQADGRRADEEPRTERRADRARPGRHLGRQVRPRQGRHPHRRRGHAEDGGVAVALQHPARAVRGAPREAGPVERRAGERWTRSASRD